MDYSKKSKAELKALCKERKIKGITGKNVKDLIKMLSDYDENQLCDAFTNKNTIAPVSAPKIEAETDVKSKLPVKVGMNSERKGVQAHGFSWEKELITKVYGATQEELKGIKYNSKMDLPSTLNHLDRCDVSVKTSCSINAVCMADCLRVYDAVSNEKTIHLVVILYKQDDTANTKKISSIVEVDLTNSRDLLFGTLTRSQIEELDKAVKLVPQKRKPTDEEYKNMYSIRDRLQENSGAIHLDIRCNSTQSRLQCSFNHFQTFLEKNATRVIAKSNTNEFRGGVISSEIKSSRRIFKKK